MEQISKLVCIFDYNKNMSGVDLLVQMMISYYPFTRKTLKWTKKIFYYFMEISANNAFVLYKVKSIQGSLIPTTRACGTVLLVTVWSWVFWRRRRPATNPSKKARGDTADRLRGGQKRHRLELFPARGVRKHAQKPCRICKKNGKRKDTSYYCVHCDVALCVIPCINKYHTQDIIDNFEIKIFCLICWLLAFQIEFASGNHQRKKLAKTACSFHSKLLCAFTRQRNKQKLQFWTRYWLLYAQRFVFQMKWSSSGGQQH